MNWRTWRTMKNEPVAAKVQCLGRSDRSGSSSALLFSLPILQITTRTRTRWTRGILSTWMNNWNPSFDSVEEVCSPGARGPPYIALPNEHGPSDQTDLNRTVFLDPQRWWSTIRETYPNWSPVQGGHPLGEGGRPAPRPARPPFRSRGFWSLLDDRKLAHTLISQCKPDVWAFPPYFLITPCRNRQTPKLMEFCQMKP